MLGFDEIRRIAIVAMFSDEVLFNALVLKGGNALTLVHHIGRRTSIDLDFSLESDFDDLRDIEDRIFAALDDRFDAVGYVVFDKRFERRPPNAEGKWGGYQVNFKIIPREKYRELEANTERLRREAESIAPGSQRVFVIQISKHEFCGGKTELEFDDYTIVVYTPEMIAIEKLRAICQQLDAYTARTAKTARARDFYDIHTITTERGVDFLSAVNRELIKQIFGAKEVPLALLGELHIGREFHRTDWDSVRQSVSGPLESFDHYFDFVMRIAQSLESLWKVNPPL